MPRPSPEFIWSFQSKPMLQSTFLNSCKTKQCKNILYDQRQIDLIRPLNIIVTVTPAFHSPPFSSVHNVNTSALLGPPTPPRPPVPVLHRLAPKMAKSLP